MDPVTDPENPTDEAPTQVAAEMEDGGPHGQFRVVPGARIECLTCRTSFDAHTVGGDHVARLEGASDPADEIIVVPLTCPNCGTVGTLSLGYGPQASPEEGDVLRALRREYHGGP